MKKSFFLVSFIIVAFTASAQKIHLTLFGGFSNYQGDLQAKRFTTDQAHVAIGFGALYEISERWYGRGNITFGKISAADKYNPGNEIRNLSFASPITDVHLGLEYCLLNPYEHSLAPYVFAGVSYFKFNPSAIDTFGNKVYLQPLSTEGEGFYQGRKAYHLGQFAIPFGAGVKFSINDNLRIGLEVGLRKTNTDYLDDVSTTYVDQGTLFANRGAQAVSMAYRGDELKNGSTYPVDGSQRGSSKYKDWYYFSGVTIAFRFPSSNSNDSRKSKMGCPSNVY